MVVWSAKSLPKTSIRWFWKSVAKRTLPEALLPMASPLKTAPGTVAPVWAFVDGAGGGTLGFQPVIRPASDAKINVAGPDAVPLLTTKSVVGLNPAPVGAPPGMWTASGETWIGLPPTSPE